MAPVLTTSDYTTYIKTLNNYTTVFDSQTTGSAPCPTLSQLPAGSLDYYKSASGDYVISTSGRALQGYGRHDILRHRAWRKQAVR